MDDPTIGLYIHFPFCRSRCSYCTFFSESYAEQSLDGYLKALRCESHMRSNLAGDSRVDSVFLGGGTPSLLKPDELADIITIIRGDFTISHDAEITVEANPESVSTGFLFAAHDAGVNRLSIGVQSLCDRELQVLGRIHTSHEARRAIQTAHDAGFDNVGADLIFGIPGQTCNSWLATLRGVLQLGVTHISAYGLTVEEGTRLRDMVESDSLALPDEEEVCRMYLDGKDLLEAEGFIHYEISNFALPGFQCLSHLNTWKGGCYLGLGPSAHSYDGKVRSWNEPDLKGYVKALMHKKVPPGGKELLTGKNRIYEKIMLGLRQVQVGISLSEMPAVSYETISAIQNRGLIEEYRSDKGEPSIRLSRKGLLLVDSVIEELIK